jgi:ribosomal protein L37AE/L43A
MTCPLCNEPIEVKMINGTPIWSCQACPFIAIEFYQLNDLKNLTNYLNQ